MFIQVSSVRSLKLTLLCVCVTIVVVTSSDVWLLDVKCRETGLKLFPWRISARWPLSLSLKVLPDWPTYCTPHLEQLMTYTMFFVWQLKLPLILSVCLVFDDVILVVFFMKRQVLQGLLQGPEPGSMFGGLRSVLTKVCFRLTTLLCTTRILLFLISLRSSDSWSKRLYLFKIFAIGGFRGL